jgi:hypothetical protein
MELEILAARQAMSQQLMLASNWKKGAKHHVTYTARDVNYRYVGPTVHTGLIQK